MLNSLFIFINLFNYIDRGFISSLDTTFVEEYNISDTESGFINSSFIIGYLVFSPIFSLLVKRYNKIVLIFVGLSIWSGFNILNTFYNNIILFIVFRSFIGAGEASYGTIVPPLIDKLSNEKSRSLMLSLYFLAMPLGFALGFILSGFLRQFMDWHYLFLLEGCCVMGLNFILLFYVKKLEKYEEEGASIGLRENLVEEMMDDKIDEMSLKDKILIILENRRFLLYQVGYIFYTFLIGTFSYWGQGYMVEFYNFTETNASYLFGGFTVGAGIIGSIASGLLLDYLKDKYGDKMRVGNLIVLVSVLVSYVCCTIIFLFNNLELFYVLFGLGQLFLFGLVGPINSILLWSMEDERMTRKLNDEVKVIGCALSICLIHVFGDVPSPILTGFIYDILGDWNMTFFISSQVLLISILFWSITLCI